jgi:hypothetical protein
MATHVKSPLSFLPRIQGAIGCACGLEIYAKISFITGKQRKDDTTNIRATMKELGKAALAAMNRFRTPTAHTAA